MNYNEMLESLKVEMSSAVNNIDEKHSEIGKLLDNAENPESILTTAKLCTQKAEEELQWQIKNIDEQFKEIKFHAMKQKETFLTSTLLKNRCDSLLLSTEVLEEFVLKEERIVQPMKAVLEEQQKNLLIALLPLRKSNILYRTFLGLDVSKKDGTLLFSFKNVCRNNPDKLFTFKLNIVDNIYHVIDCDPPLPGVENVVQKLNANNNLREFVVQMRKSMANAVVA